MGLAPEVSKRRLSAKAIPFYLLAFWLVWLPAWHSYPLVEVVVAAQ